MARCTRGYRDGSTEEPRKRSFDVSISGTVVRRGSRAGWAGRLLDFKRRDRLAVWPRSQKQGEDAMKFLSMYKSVERNAPPSQEEMAKMGKLVEDGMKDGWLVATE